jgi:histidine triad (HIT) family protein
LSKQQFRIGAAAMENCLFCKIIRGEIPSKTVYEDEFTIGICDIQPAAPKHYLFIPKTHVSSLAELTPQAAQTKGLNVEEFVGKYYKSLLIFIERDQLDKEGFRLVTNSGKSAGQTVFHLHTHILAGMKVVSHL